MKKLHTAPRLLCLALAAAFPLAAHAEDDVERLTKPTSTVTLGVGFVSEGNQRFGTYNGMTENGSHVIGEASILRRNDEAGTWLRFDARNIGLPSRELRVEHEKQGDWAYYFEYNQIPRVAPYDVHTNLVGAGDPAQVHAANAANAALPRSTASESDFLTQRYKSTLGFTKLFGPQLEFAVKFQNEEKHGERIFGRGTPSLQEFLAEPIDSSTRQIDATLAYLGQNWQLTGGYYGSFYSNHNPMLQVTGGAAGLATFSTIALPPDNQAHQFYVNGGYDFTRTTRATFKYSQMRAIQDDGFILPVRNAAPTAANTLTNDSGRNSLGGLVDITLFQAGITSRPTRELSLLANYRYEDRNDKTDVAQYIFIAPPPAAGSSTTGFNEPRSLRTVNGKLEANYQLPAGYRLTGGVDYEDKKRTMSGVRVVGYRAETEEVSYRAELKRSLTDTVSGTLAFVSSERDGSHFINLRNSAGVLTPTTAQTLASGALAQGGLLQPVYIADRQRDKVKLLADWSPVDALSLQFVYEDSRDRYEDRDRTPQDVGARSGGAQLYSFDASYALNDNWKLNGYASAYTTRIKQGAINDSPTPDVYWAAAMKNIGTNIGFGVKGKIGGKFEVGADLLWAEDNNEYRYSGPANAAGVNTSLPDIDSKQTAFKLYGTYAYDKNTTIRLDYTRDKRTTNDWTWNGVNGNPYTYTDGTWLYQDPNETVHFIGVSMQYSFR